MHYLLKPTINFINIFFKHLCTAISRYKITNDVVRLNNPFQSALTFDSGSNVAARFCGTYYSSTHQDYDSSMFCSEYQVHSNGLRESIIYWMNLFISNIKHHITTTNNLVVESSPSTNPNINVCYHGFNYNKFATGLIATFAALTFSYFALHFLKKLTQHLLRRIHTARAENNIYASYPHERGEGEEPRHIIIRRVEERIETSPENIEEDQDENIYDYIDPSTLINVEDCQSTAPLSSYEVTRS